MLPQTKKVMKKKFATFCIEQGLGREKISVYVVLKLVAPGIEVETSFKILIALKFSDI